MHATPYGDLVVFILSVDRPVMAYLLPVNLCFAIAILAFVGRPRRNLQTVWLLIFIYTLLMLGSVALFHFFLLRPVLRLEAVSWP
jgi:hypothetical protein